MLSRPLVRRLLVAALASGLVIGSGAQPATAGPDPGGTAALPWPAPGSPPLPPDPTVPYLPGVRTLCPDGALSCFHELQSILENRTETLGCAHEAIASDAYLTITRRLIDASSTPGYFDRPDRINHEARQYAQEYFDQADRWHSGDRSSVSPAWRVALRAMDEESVTGTGDLLLWLNAHIRRDNPIRAIEQSEGVLRVPGTMPAASGRHDHEQVSEALANSVAPMLEHNAAVYDDTVDDGVQLFGTVFDPKGAYALISSWREEAWRNAEQLRHARALGGVNGWAYQAKLAQIEASALLGARAIKAATAATPAGVERRNAYCAAHVGGSA